MKKVTIGYVKGETWGMTSWCDIKRRHDVTTWYKGLSSSQKGKVMSHRQDVSTGRWRMPRRRKIEQLKIVTCHAHPVLVKIRWIRCAIRSFKIFVLVVTCLVAARAVRWKPHLAGTRKYICHLTVVQMMWLIAHAVISRWGPSWYRSMGSWWFNPLEIPLGIFPARPLYPDQFWGEGVIINFKAIFKLVNLKIEAKMASCFWPDLTQFWSDFKN